MIFDSNFQSTQEHKEIFPVESVEFPFICNYVELDKYMERSFPWHWHPFLELDYVSEGEMEFKIANHVYPLKKGDLIFINSGIMHTLSAKDKMSGCKIYSHLFDMHFLSGMDNSLFEQKYLLPILKSAELPVYVIRPDSYRRIRMIENFLNIVKLCEQEPFGYEFEIRTELSRFWCMLLEETAGFHNKTTARDTLDIARLKTMIAFIHENYMEKISLEDISSCANISSRECSRCFQRSIKTSPMNYLTEYRIRMAAQMLLQTNDSVLTISENCGFTSSSYFSKVFQNYMGCTPKKYRTK